MRALGPNLAAAGVSAPQLLPCYGVGHSVGGLIHLLISARYAVQVGRRYRTWVEAGSQGGSSRVRSGKRAAFKAVRYLRVVRPACLPGVVQGWV